MRERVRQRELSRVRCEWGREANVHAVVHPVFGRNYRVRGLLAFTPSHPLVWYGEMPVHAEQGLIRFKATTQEEGAQPLETVDAELFQDSFFCDPWGMVTDLLGLFAERSGRAIPRNVYGQSLQGRPIVDVVFEPGVHRVHAVMVRGGWWRLLTLPVLGIPSLAESMAPGTPENAEGFRWPWRTQA